MSGNSRDRRRRRGTALIMALGYLAVITMMATAFFSLCARSISAASETQRHRACLSLAESGVEYAIAHLRQAPETYRGGEELALGDGRFSVAVQALPEPGAFRIVSIGRLGEGAVVRAQTRVEADVVVSAGGVAITRWMEMKR